MDVHKAAMVRMEGVVLRDTEEACTTWFIDADNGKGGEDVSLWTKAPFPEHVSLEGSQREIFTVGFPVIYILNVPVQLLRISSAFLFFQFHIIVAQNSDPHLLMELNELNNN